MDICGNCGADKDAWEETFGTRQCCQLTEEDLKIRQMTLKVMAALRRNGIPYFTFSNILDPRIDKLIKGEG